MLCMDGHCLFWLNPSSKSSIDSRFNLADVACTIIPSEDVRRRPSTRQVGRVELPLVNMDIIGFPSSPVTVGGMQHLREHQQKSFSQSDKQAFSARSR